MKYAILIISFSLLFLSCQKDRNGCGYYTGFPKANVISSYPPFDAYAYFGGDDINDCSIVVYSLGDSCYPKNKLVFSNIDLEARDTLNLIDYNLDSKGMTSLYFIKDIDAIVEIYTLIENSNTNNWLFVENVTDKNRLVTGKFSCTFVTEYEDYLSGERERWDDPNRPDTIHFEGSFTARKE
ncbi:MAG: hypothetical protein KDD49_12505 [Bacteroidetes bacterium]|nr:hypothetical protein [Bacteroidota bacterium]